MEKIYQDYAHHLRCAVGWYQQIGKRRYAEEYHQIHLDWANGLLAEFKEKYR